MRSEIHLNKVIKNKKDFSEYINNKDSQIKERYDKRNKMLQSLDEIKKQELDKKREDKELAVWATV